MKKVPIISPNSARLKKDDYTFFVLRSKVSTLASTNKYKDIFCVVRDSYADQIYKDGITNGWYLYENSNAQENECFLPSKETHEFFRNTSEKTTEIDKLPISSPDTSLFKRDVTTYSVTTYNNYSPDTQRVFNLKLFRMYLMFFFAVHPNTSISYMDNDDKVHSVQTETEFLELWKFAKSCSKNSKGVLLLVDFTNNQDDSMINSNDKIPMATNQKSLCTDDVNLSQTFQSDESTTEEKGNNNIHSSKRVLDLVEENDNNLLNNKDDTSNSLGNLTESYSKICTKDIGDMKLTSIAPSDINSQDFLNNDPPMWFVRYMEQLKKDIITEVSDQVMANVMENLNECPVKLPMHTRYRDTFQCENQVYNNKSKCNRQKINLFMDQRRHHKSIVKTRKKKEKKLEEKREYNSEDDNKEKENNHNIKYNTSELMDNTNNIIENEIVNNRDSMSSDFHEFQFPSSKENLYDEPDDTIIENETINNRDSMSPDFHEFQLPPLKENLYNEPHVSNVTKENEFYSKKKTKHEMLDKKHVGSKTCCCGSDIENISVHSDVSNEEETCNEYTFEMIQKPTNCEGDINYISKDSALMGKLKNHFSKRNKKNTKDHSNFELYPEMASPSSSSIYINEDHFTASSNNVFTSPVDNDLNISSTHKSDGKEYSVREDGSKKIHNAHQFDASNKRINSNLKKFTNKICKSIIENSSNPSHNEIKLLDTESECEEVNNMKTDVNNSHISYMTTEPINTIYSDFPTAQHSCQAQTDINDLTQSFHSHTTSITDNGVYDIRETNTSSSHDYSKHSLSDLSKSTSTNSKENKTREQTRKDFNIKNPEKKMSREENNAKNGKHVVEDTATNSVPGTAEPVHILPETLVNGALHFASFAYGTAREAIVKIRSNSKDDRSSHTRKARH